MEAREAARPGRAPTPRGAPGTVSALTWGFSEKLCVVFPYFAVRSGVLVSNWTDLFLKECKHLQYRRCGFIALPPTALFSSYCVIRKTVSEHPTHKALYTALLPPSMQTQSGCGAAFCSSPLTPCPTRFSVSLIPVSLAIQVPTDSNSLPRSPSASGIVTCSRPGFLWLS